ncbi:hypothetical protein QBC34DRAFT_378023 [Podospora aff. communis PSN243]|uniref:Uncharacterized protein n=1 Tax=Podospora aff. communis PSN243 TaxID=3040156 RepID=A0AAV9GW27_9PEZI|nr:hypothetical protein QBC34DRAFT_378023 [Podospora aff. communis PSN243]
MKLSYVFFISLQALTAAANPTKSHAQLIKDEVLQLSSRDLANGTDVEAQACNYGNCDGCLERFSYCVQCNSWTSPPSACVNWCVSQPVSMLSIRKS